MGIWACINGSIPVPQPLIGGDSALLWNGDLFGGGVHVGTDESDTKVLKQARKYKPYTRNKPI